MSRAHLKWEATHWPAAEADGRGLSSGAFSLQTAWACGQRVWKVQPDGGLAGLGETLDW